MSDNLPELPVGFCPTMDTGADMQEATPSVPRDTHAECHPLEAWRALWALEDEQPLWLHDSVSAMDAAIQGQMGHS